MLAGDGALTRDTGSDSAGPVSFRDIVIASRVMHFTGVTGAVLARVALCSSFLVALGGCSEREDEPAETTFYSRRVEPILHESCAASPTRSGCHVKSEDQRHALGNLSFDTYEDLALKAK